MFSSFAAKLSTGLLLIFVAWSWVALSEMKHTQICPMEHGASREMSHKFRCTQVEATVRFSSFFECRPSAVVGLELGRFLELMLRNIISIIRPTRMSSTNKRSYCCRMRTTQLTWDIPLRLGNLEVGGNMGREWFSTLPLCA